ncbi:hypothetical protein C8R43DRAFT_456010 [Mycena crocata]|nr:hypothetical protein C8R43DRAFT_456010 [Mycena crocata]
MWMRTQLPQMSLEKDLGSLRRSYEARAVELASLKSEVRGLRVQQNGDYKKILECRNLLLEREGELHAKKAELQKMTEELSLSKKLVERQVARLQEKAAGSGSSRETELENELKLTMNVLKCTACKGAEFRDTVLTKCMHSQSHKQPLSICTNNFSSSAFCRSCVDARLSTRQRKCPACNGPFAVADVQTIYLQ